MNLEDIRNEIDEIDRQIVEAIEKRMKLCRDVAQYKIDTGKQVLDRQRELDKLKALKGLASNEFNRLGIQELFEQIMAQSRKMQYQLLNENGVVTNLPFEMVPSLEKRRARVVFQGVEGAYSQAAMFQFFGEAVNGTKVKTWDEAMKALSAGTADFAVLPIENSSAGAVSDVYDLMTQYDHYIVGETYLQVNHVLLGLPEAEMADINTVYSHPQGLMQCSRFLAEHKDWKLYSVDNTALSALKVLDEADRGHAAVASELAGKLYGLKVLRDDIMNSDNNITRFIIVSSRKMYTENASKVSVCFETPHESGSLYTMLSHFIFNNLSMTKIESRPIPGKSWQYRFFVDFEGNLSDAGVKNALRGILEEANYFRILGNY